MGSQARSLIGIRFLHPAKVKTNLASALSLDENGWYKYRRFLAMAVYSSKLDTLLIWLNENVGKNLRFLAMAAYSSKLDTLLIWLNENVLQGVCKRGTALARVPCSFLMIDENKPRAERYWCCSR